MTEVPESTRRMLELIDASPSPWHAVSEVSRRLEAAGFTRLREGDAWSLDPSARHFVVRGGTSIAAFVVGTAPVAEAGFRLVGAHVDSPNLRLKPHAERLEHGYLLAGVEVYGGALLASWTDRDLALAGRLVLAPSSTSEEPESHLVHLARPVARIPQLAIHLDRDVNEKGLQLNAQQHLSPVMGLSAPASAPGGSSGETSERILEAVAAEADTTLDAILGFDLMFCDAAPSVVAGLDGELVHAPRLDDLSSCHAALEALLQTAGTSCPATRGFVLYDHEEVGSQSAVGAQSAFLASTLERVVAATGGGAQDAHRAMGRSLLVSADTAHAVHPNYSDRHEPKHRPSLNGGPVIKTNANQRYATTGETAARFRQLARDCDVPVQEYVNRSDLPCGSTIGPITAARVGLPTVDVGLPILSMHSAREMCGSRDPEMLVRVLSGWWEA